MLVLGAIRFSLRLKSPLIKCECSPTRSRNVSIFKNNFVKTVVLVISDFLGQERRTTSNINLPLSKRLRFTHILGCGL